MSDFDIVEEIKDAGQGLKKTFGKKTPWIIGGGVALAAGLGIYALMKSGGEQGGYGYDSGSIGVTDPGYIDSGGGAVLSPPQDFSSFFEDLMSMQQDTSDLIADQQTAIGRLTDRIEVLSSGEKSSNYQTELNYLEQILSKGTTSKQYDDLVKVNKGIEGNVEYERASSVEARQYERYLKAAEEGNTKYMDIVKKETESALGKSLDWDDKSSSSKSSSKSTKSSSSSSKSSADIIYVEGGITYENKGGVIYKNGKVVPKENYKYIPTQVGGTRK